jgi:hypothetical protein
LNPQPADYKSAALPIEPRQQRESVYIVTKVLASKKHFFFLIYFASFLKSLINQVVEKKQKL